MKIKIPFQLPTLNEMIAWSGSIMNHRSGKRFTSYNKEKRELEENLVTLMRPLSAEDPIPHPAEIACHWIRGNRRHDPDNIAAGKKYILDSLKEAGILTNDGWAQIAGFEDSFAVGEPGVIVELRRSKEDVIKDLIKLVFSSAMYVERTYNADPTFEILEKVEEDLNTVMATLTDMVRGEQSRFDFLEELITPEWRDESDG